VERGDVTAAANHYALAIATAWDYNPVVGGRISRFVLRHLRSLLQPGKEVTAHAIYEHVLKSVRERIGVEHPEALLDLEQFGERLDS
jgi:hypothetical protein